MITVEYASPCGRLLLGAQGMYLCLCDWIVEGRIEKSLRRLQKYSNHHVGYDNPEILSDGIAQLDEYFAGERHNFDIPLKAYGSPFQHKVWRILPTISYGERATYREIAEKIGSPSAVRAVAGAIGANPLSIFIPCHRIVGSDGSLGGYAGGKDAKSYLLALES